MSQCLFLCLLFGALAYDILQIDVDDKKSDTGPLQEWNISKLCTTVSETSDEATKNHENKEPKYNAYRTSPSKRSVGRRTSELPPVLRRQSTSPIKKAYTEGRSRLQQTSSPLRAPSSRLCEAVEQQLANTQ